jgi:S-adenosylmethionine synthetase
MTQRVKYITSESVTLGHPDKVADYISDSLLTEILKSDKEAHVAIETLVTKDVVVVAGEVTSFANIDRQKVIRNAIKELGYTDDNIGFSDNASIIDLIHKQSSDINMGVSKDNGEIGAGDQGFMIGYASNETENYMPLPIAIAKALTNRLTEVREKKLTDYLKPDGKSQVTVKYADDEPISIDTVIISNQHIDIDINVIRDTIKKLVIDPVIVQFGFFPEDIRSILINPTGRFVIGGPAGDTGVTGRKIVIDQYGSVCPVGGGAFSGKDPSKVDRSGAYAARWIAKNIVAAGLADRCEVQLSYAIGVSQPTSVCVDTKGTAKIDESKIEQAVKEVFDLRPVSIIRQLNLLDINYKEVDKLGVFGNDKFNWEKLNKVDELKKYKEE